MLRNSIRRAVITACVRGSLCVYITVEDLGFLMGGFRCPERFRLRSCAHTRPATHARKTIKRGVPWNPRNPPGSATVLPLASSRAVANPVLNLLMLVRAVEIMVKSHPEHVNVRDQQQCTPLHLAASEGEVEVAKTLLDVVRLLVVFA